MGGQQWEGEDMAKRATPTDVVERAKPPRIMGDNPFPPRSPQMYRFRALFGGPAPEVYLTAEFRTRMTRSPSPAGALMPVLLLKLGPSPCQTDDASTLRKQGIQCCVEVGTALQQSGNEKRRASGQPSWSMISSSTCPIVSVEPFTVIATP